MQARLPKRRFANIFVNEWTVQGKFYRRSEHAALAYYESIGYKGFFDEGRAPYMMLKYACLDVRTDIALMTHRSRCVDCPQKYTCTFEIKLNTEQKQTVSQWEMGLPNQWNGFLGGDINSAMATMHETKIKFEFMCPIGLVFHYDSVNGSEWTGYTCREDAFLGLGSRKDIENRPLLVEAIRQATPDMIAKQIRKMGYLRHVPTSYHDTDNEQLTVERFLAIWNSIGNEGWVKFLEARFERPLAFYPGFPDLTIAQGNFLRFVEVKSNSCPLNKNQIKVISEILHSLCLSVSVLQIVPEK